jgi:hypothetical protein
VEVEHPVEDDSGGEERRWRQSEHRFHAQPEEADISLPVDLVKADDTVTMGLQMESKQKSRVWTGIPVKTEVPKGALNVFA